MNEKKVEVEVEVKAKEKTQVKVQEGTQDKVQEETKVKVQEETQDKVEEGTQDKVQEGTQDKVREETQVKVKEETIEYLYQRTRKSWFSERVKLQDVIKLCDVIFHGDEDIFESVLQKILEITVHYHYSREPFYIGILAAIVQSVDGVEIQRITCSRAYKEIVCIRSKKYKHPVLICVKVTYKRSDLEYISEEAISQIADTDKIPLMLGKKENYVIMYGIGFYKKECIVKKRIKEL